MKTFRKTIHACSLIGKRTTAFSTVWLLILTAGFVQSKPVPELKIHTVSFPESKWIQVFQRTPTGYLVVINVEEDTVIKRTFYFTNYPVLVSLDSQFQVRWAKKWPSDKYCKEFNLIQMGGLLYLQGYRSDPGAGAPWLTCLDENGTLKWHKTYPMAGTTSNEDISMKTLPDGKIMTICRRYFPGNSLGTIYLSYLDADGNIIWERPFGQSYKYYVPGDVVADGDGYAYVSGSVYPTRVNDYAEDSRAHLLKIDLKNGGKIVWERKYDNWMASFFGKIRINADKSLKIEGDLHIKGEGLCNTVLTLSEKGDILKEHHAQFVKRLTMEDFNNGEHQRILVLYSFPGRDLFIEREPFEPQYQNDRGSTKLKLYDAQLNPIATYSINFYMNSLKVLDDHNMLIQGKGRMGTIWLE